MNSGAGVTSAHTVSDTNAPEPGEFPVAYFPGTNIRAKDGM